MNNACKTRPQSKESGITPFLVIFKAKKKDDFTSFFIFICDTFFQSIIRNFFDKDSMSFHKVNGSDLSTKNAPSRFGSVVKNN